MAVLPVRGIVYCTRTKIHVYGAIKAIRNRDVRACIRCGTGKGAGAGQQMAADGGAEG